MEWKLHKTHNSAVSTFRGYESDGHCWGEVSIKWDGCIDLSLAGNCPYDDDYGYADTKREHPACDDGIHICDIESFIAMLRQIQKEQEEIFPDLRDEKKSTRE